MKRSRIKPKTTKVCKSCKTTFRPYTTLDKYCSPKCMMQAGVATKVKKRKYQKSRGKTGDTPKLIQSKKQLKAESRREFGRLQCHHPGCNSTEWMECHHIIYRSEAPKHPMLHEKINLIYLCKTHHEYYHEKKSRRRQLVEDRGLDEVFGSWVFACELKEEIAEEIQSINNTESDDNTRTLPTAASGNGDS